MTSLVCDDVSVCDEGKVTVDPFSRSDFTAKIFWLASPHLLDECCSGDLLIGLLIGDVIGGGSGIANTEMK